MNQQRGKRLYPAVAGATVLVTLLGISVAAARVDQSGLRPAAAPPSSGPGVNSRPGLDDVPGLGRTPVAAQRDEIISVWEAWRRAKSMAVCMREAGFEYAPDVAYPDEALVQVGRSLDVAVDTHRPEDSLGDRAWNRRHVDSLEGERRNAYFRNLYGESAATMDHAARTGGRLPEGVSANDFASGGCFGRAERSVGSIWSLERQLADELDGLRHAARQTPEFQAAVREYAVCSAEQGGPSVAGPADLEAAFDRGATDFDGLTRVQRECSEIWMNADREATARAVAELSERHAAELAGQRAKYIGALERIRHDAEFREFLSSRLAELE